MGNEDSWSARIKQMLRAIARSREGFIDEFHGPNPPSGGCRSSIGTSGWKACRICTPTPSARPSSRRRHNHWSSSVQRLTSNTIFAGFAGKGPLGIGASSPRPASSRHIRVTFWGMYVRQEARRTGLARQLVETVLDYARDRVELIQLSVTAHNQAARRLYTSLGFEPYGIDVTRTAGRGPVSGRDPHG